LIVAGAVQLVAYDFLRARQWIVLMSTLQLAETLATIAAIAVLLPVGRPLMDLLVVIFFIKAATIAVFFVWILLSIVHEPMKC